MVLKVVVYRLGYALLYFIVNVLESIIVKFY